MAVRIVDLSPDDLRTRMGDALGIYVAAMGYPPGTAAHRAPMWAEHMLRAGWQAAAAVGDDPSGTGPACAPLLGIAYGYRGARRRTARRRYRPAAPARGLRLPGRTA